MSIKSIAVLLCTVLQLVLMSTANNCINCDNEIRVEYEPTWESLDKRPLPEWYNDAKVGIFIHWGVYSVPCFGSEWFWTNWKSKVKTYVDFMEKNYRPGFTYQDFATDFKAELFNSTKWALLFKESGAKYVVLTSKHHDGYALWPSDRSFSWNSVDVGAKIDIVGELAVKVKNTGLKFGLYYSLFEWYNRLYENDKKSSFKTKFYVEDKVLPELHEIIEKYKPEVIWSDGDWEALPDYWNSTEFISWLYNESPVRDTVVVNDRWGIGALCQHGDFYTCSDRYNPGFLTKHKWENAFTLDRTTWGHRSDSILSNYLTSKDLINELVVTVSCNGNILVNVGPTKYGTIQPIFEERLTDMGRWLEINGEAIYASKYWSYQNDTISKGVWFTAKDDQKNRLNVYAIVLNYPYDTNEITLGALLGKTDNQTKVSMLGMLDMKVKWSTKEKGINIKFPQKRLIDKQGLEYAWTLKINIPKESL